MRGHTNGLTLHFINILLFSNLLFLVAGQSVTMELNHGYRGTTVNVSSKTAPHDSPSPSPIAPPIGYPSTSDSSPTPITTSTSTPASPSSTGAALGSFASTQTHLSPGVIAGIVVSAVTPLLFALGFLLYRRKRKRQIPYGGPVNLSVDLDPIGSPIYEKQLIPSPFLTDTEATQLGCDQPTKRIEAKFTTADGINSAPIEAQLSVPFNHVHTSAPILLSNSRYSLEPPTNSRSTLASSRPSTASSEDTLTEEAPPLHMQNQWRQPEYPHDASHNFQDLTEEGIARAL